MLMSFRHLTPSPHFNIIFSNSDNSIIVVFHNFPATCLPAFLRSMTPLMFRIDRFHQCKRLAKYKGVRDMPNGVDICPSCVGVISKGVCPFEYVIGSKGKTVSLFLTEALGRIRCVVQMVLL